MHASKHDLCHRPPDAIYNSADGSDVFEGRQAKGLQRILVRPPTVCAFYGAVSYSSIEVRPFDLLLSQNYGQSIKINGTWPNFGCIDYSVS